MTRRKASHAQQRKSLTLARQQKSVISALDNPGLQAKDAQVQVKAFSSKKYMSHRRVPETVAHVFDH
jgi:hypothetical protein